jgi:hypothetical protein
MESLDVAVAAHRAIVVLNVPWSAYARRAVATLESAFHELGELEIAFAVVDEESSDVRTWVNQKRHRA